MNQDGFFYGLFLALEKKCGLTTNDFGNIEEHKTFERFNVSKRLLDRFQFFKMIEGKNITATLPKKWKKSFRSGVIIPAKMRFRNESNDEILCDRSSSQINENKEGNLNLLKRQPPNQFCCTLPYLKE